LIFGWAGSTLAAEFALTVTTGRETRRGWLGTPHKGEKRVQDLTERRNEEAREVRDLLAAKLKMHPVWLGSLDTQAARHIYLFIQALEGRKPFGRVRRQRAPNLTLD
jgi:hypothetical protein